MPRITLTFLLILALLTKGTGIRFVVPKQGKPVFPYIDEIILENIALFYDLPAIDIKAGKEHITIWRGDHNERFQ